MARTTVLLNCLERGFVTADRLVKTVYNYTDNESLQSIAAKEE